MESILVVAPHADDEILGCGGTIARYASEKKNVYVAIMTNAHIGDSELFSKEDIEVVRNEAIQAHNSLGVVKTFFFDFPAPRLDSFPSYRIADKLSSLIKQLRIDTVFIPHRGDIHQDHRIIFEASLVACRPVNSCTVKNIFAYETLSETEWAAPFADDAFIPNLYIQLSKNHVEAKKGAMDNYKSQLRKFPHSRSIEGIECLSKLRGATISCPAAEAFMIMRTIVDIET